ncbi:MAG TPA: polysaccharide biosynthesis C-terminal domain-containing protein, partial [Balneolaceae bacterium]|nr:polysaccharide biosynthesis C-terminal domain-containing protein [Balneolaceae bacterium]
VYKISGPVISEAYTHNNFDLIEEIYKRSSLNHFIIGGLILCGIIANLNNLMHLLPPEYANIEWVIIIIGAGYLFQLLSGLNGGIILNSDYYRYDFLFTSIFIATAIGLNYWLIPIYDITGAAVATACAIIFYNLMKVIFVQICFVMQPYQWQMIPVFIIGAVTLIITFQIPFIANPLC